MILIDADSLPRYGKRGGLVNWYDIKKAPTVELIRCKDCKHYDIQVQQCTCEADWFGIKPNGFCSRAERKSE